MLAGAAARLDRATVSYTHLLDVEEDDIEKLIPTLKENKGEPFGSFKKLTMDDAREIYRIAL